jgi:hypothetical protein
MAGKFAVHLGAGVYLDSEGIITFQVPAATQVFQAPSGFKADFKKLQDLFKDLSGILPSSEDDKAKWIKWGAPKNVVEMLSSVAGVAGVAGTAIATYFWAVGAIVSLMSLISDDGGLSPQMEAAFATLRGLAKGNEQIRLVEKAVTLLEPFKTKAARMQGLINVLKTSGPTGPASNPIYEEMRTLLNDLEPAVGALCDEPWLALVDTDDFKGRFFLATLLVTVEPDGTLKPVPASPAVAMFNYRIGVPALLYGFTTYGALLRAAMPWFRTQGQYAPLLRRAADAVDLFVMNMQALCLARTNHSGFSIVQEDLMITPQIPDPVILPRAGRPRTYPVGAFDLANYSDAYLMQQYSEQFAANGDLGRRGALDYSFAPPENMRDLDEIAALANDQAVKDYTELQAVSGEFHMLKLAAELRWLSTPPMTSEIVRGKSDAERQLVAVTEAEAVSPTIFPVGVIRSPARLRSYNARGHVVAVTQEPGFFGPKFYRVFLRTLHSEDRVEGWRKHDYVEDVWRPRYRKADGDPKNLQLDSSILTLKDENEVFLFSREMIPGGGHSSPEPRADGGTIKLEADTFDWYVPVFRTFSPFVEPDTEARRVSPDTGHTKPTPRQRMATSGGLSLHARSGMVEPLPLGGGQFPLTTMPSDLWDDGDGGFSVMDNVSLERAERRHVRRSTVTLEWKLTWTGSDLRVDLKGKPDERPFQVFVVVEERSYSGAADSDNTIQLHMPFAVEIVNQVTLVPEEFFKKEAAALERGEKLYNDLNSKFAQSGPVAPGDPVVGMLDRVRKDLARSQSTATIAAGLNTRLEFMRETLPNEFRELMGGYK